MLHQTLHVRIAIDTQKICLLVCPNGVMRQDVLRNFPPFVGQKVISYGPTKPNEMLISQMIMFIICMLTF